MIGVVHEAPRATRPDRVRSPSGVPRRPQEAREAMFSAHRPAIAVRGLDVRPAARPRARRPPRAPPGTIPSSSLISYTSATVPPRSQICPACLPSEGGSMGYAAAGPRPGASRSSRAQDFLGRLHEGESHVRGQGLRRRGSRPAERRPPGSPRRRPARAADGTARRRPAARAGERAEASAITKYVPAGRVTRSRRPPARRTAGPGGRRGGQGARGVVVPARACAMAGWNGAPDVGEELLDRPHRRDQVGRPVHPADLPAGERERLARRRDRQRPLRHPRQRRDRDVLGAEREVLVDLVGHDYRVALPGDGGDRGQLVPRRAPSRSGCAGSSAGSSAVRGEAAARSASTSSRKPSGPGAGERRRAWRPPCRSRRRASRRTAPA